MSKCAQKIAEQQWDIDKPKMQAACQQWNIHDIPSDEVKDLDATNVGARKKLEISVEPAMPCVVKGREETLQHCAQGDSLTKGQGK